jgi:hypothetical protein
MPLFSHLKFFLMAGFLYNIQVGVIGGSALMNIIEQSQKFETILDRIESKLGVLGGGTVTKSLDNIGSKFSEVSNAFKNPLTVNNVGFSDTVDNIDKIGNGFDNALSKKSSFDKALSLNPVKSSVLDSPSLNPVKSVVADIAQQPQGVINATEKPKSLSFMEKAKTPLFKEGGFLGKYESSITSLNDRYTGFVEKVSNSTDKLSAPLEGMFTKVFLLDHAFNNQILPTLDKFSNDYLGKSIFEVQGLGTALGYWQTGIESVNLAYGLYTSVISGASVVTDLMTGAQTGLNFVLNMNPIGLVVGGVAALGAGLYFAYQKSETFRAGLFATWETLKVFGGMVKHFALDPLYAFAEILKGIFTGDIDLIKQGMFDNVTALKNISTDFTTAGQQLGTAFTNGWNEGKKDFSIGTPTALELPQSLQNVTALDKAFNKQDATKKDSSKEDNKIHKGIESITSGGEKSRNITINVAGIKVSDSMTVINDSTHQSPQQFSDEVLKKLVQIINNANSMQMG